jgi:hypothetical protein
MLTANYFHPSAVMINVMFSVTKFFIQERLMVNNQEQNIDVGNSLIISYLRKASF